jgi:membrane protein required for colicin V production
MNSFDIIVAVFTAVAVTFGFKVGLLRSAVTILGYVLAMPIAVWATTLIVPQVAGQPSSPLTQNSTIFFGCFVLSGIALGTLLRMAVDQTIGSEIGILDRLGGAALGAVRIFLVAVTLVLVFDELIPTSLQPAYLVGSRLRPILSAAGQKGFKSLPPNLIVTFDQLKRTSRI